MAKLTFSSTLNDSSCQALSRHLRQPVLISKHDTEYAAGSESARGNNLPETIIPAILFADNVLPTISGFKNAAYFEAVAAISASAEIMCAEVAIVAAGVVYVYAYVVDTVIPANTGHWVVKSNVDETFSWLQLAAETLVGTPAISLASINGRSFVHFSGIKTKEITVDAIADVTLGGLTATSLLGICASSGYLLAWTADTLHWSALDDPTDFAFSSSSGAGSTQIQELKGSIVTCKSHTSGFLVFSDINAVYAQAASDFRFPFIFKEVSNIAGVATAADVSSGLTQDQYVKSGSIIAKITKTQSAAVLKDFNGFCNEGMLESYINGNIVERTANNSIESKLYTMAGGIVIASYKESADANFTAAIYFSTELNKYGKLSKTHRYVVQFPFDALSIYSLVSSVDDALYNEEGMLTSADAAVDASTRILGNSVVAFVAATGSVQVLVDKLDWPQSGTVIFGPFQALRTMSIMLDSIELTRVDVNAVTVDVLTSYTGVKIDKVTRVAGVQHGSKAVFNTRVSGLNHAIAVQGTFDLSTLLLTVVPRGSGR